VITLKRANYLRDSIIVKSKAYSLIPIGAEQSLLLYRLARDQQKEGDILEMGTGPGFSSLVMALGILDGERNTILYSIDTFEAPKHKKGVLDYHRKHGLEKSPIVLIEGRTEDICREEKLYSKTFRMIFIDSSHFYKDVKRDMENALRIADSETLILMHDYHPEHKGVTKAVIEALNSKILVKIGSLGSLLVARKGEK